VVEAENVLPNEALRRGMVLRRMCRYIVHGFSSNQRMAVLTTFETQRLLQCRLLFQPVVKVCL